MTRTHARLALAFILLFGFVARASTFRSPLLDHHAWRQADTAAIARNFHREHFNILYPQIDWRGPQPTGYVETGLELPAFIVAATARLGGFHVEAGRLLSALAFLASASLTWSFVRRRDGQPAAAVATFVYAFGFPLMLYMERAFMNEAVLVALSLAALWSTQRFLATGRPGAWLSACLATALVGAIKLPYLIVLAPMLGLFVERRRGAIWKSGDFALIAIVGIAASALWYWHAHRLALQTGFTFGLGTKVLDFDLAFSSGYAVRILRRLLRDVLGPVGLAALAGGLWVALRSGRRFEIFGVAGFVAYLVLVPAGNLAHDYYQLALIPIAAPIIGLGLGAAYGHLSSRFAASERAVGLLGAILIAAALSTFVRLASFHSWFDYSPPDIEFCRRASSLGAPSDRVIVMAQDADPKFLFCMDRKGWVLGGEETSVHRVRTAWTEGARYAFLSDGLERPDVRALLDEIGTPLEIGGPFRTYRLK